ncbi:MAG: FAD:protein FMN transferase [Lentimicrobium sp.]|uniref:FAD:protein FMN transferase n=1 Tax=Lentimicrobium sp. TaxID=2034841 RepID=UPI0025DE82EA|nr:FAD:protein FMN transferase [Lentimicrobium sp.]MCO5257219.1 FAD:protein FMN transferase [Lentimicrobium sp.]
MTKTGFLSLIAVSVVMASCGRMHNLKEVKLNGMAQGTYYAITYYDEEGRNFQPAIDSFFRAFDMSASVYLKESVISRFNNNDSTAVADDAFTYVFKKAQEVSEMTDGAFDITTMPLTNAWGFGFTDAMKLSQEQVDSILPLVNYRNISLENGRLIKADPAIMIDYNAIAQGYSADLIGKMLETEGIKNYLIDVGGEVLARGAKPGGKLWRVGIEKPAGEGDETRTVDVVVKLKDKALASSGNYRRYFVKDGVKYSHTIDPKTGYPVTHSLLSVSVLADDCITADAFATAFMVMGVEKSRDFLIKHPGLEAHFIFSDAQGTNQHWTSPGLEKLFEDNNAE